MSDQQQSTTQAFLISDQQPQQKSQTFVKKTAAQRELYESGNELAAYAAKQINYHIMGYYPITPSTQIAENLDLSGARGEHNIRLIAAEGEHSAAGICYGASAGGGRVFNATSANGLLYALEQFPVQSGTRMPMVMNVACRTVSGPLCIKGDHSDIMYLLNTGWIILFADDPQMVYDFNLIALKLAEKVNLPVVVAFDGFFTSHQKQKCMVFSEDETVQHFIGKKLSCDDPGISAFAGNDSTGENHFYSVLDLNHPISVGSYMNEPDIINNKYQLFLAMEETRKKLPMLFDEFASLSGRMHTFCRGYLCEDADIILFLLGSSFHTATVAADTLRKEGIRAGVVTLNVLRPFPSDELRHLCMHAKTIVAADRQDSYGADGGNMSLELRAALQDITDSTHPIRVLTRIYGLGGKDFFVEDAVALFREGLPPDAKAFDYYGITPGTVESSSPYPDPTTEQNTPADVSSDTKQEISVSSQPDTKFSHPQPQYYAPLTKDRQSPGVTTCTFDPATGKMLVKGGLIKDATAMPKRIAPGIGTCPGCGIPVNLNLLLKGIEGNVVFLFQTGCGMVTTTAYPKTAFRIPYIHNLFQNGAATLSGLVEVFEERQKRGEYPKGEITFIMASGDGGMDIGMGSALGTALRGHHLLLFEYDNGGYMNTGYQLSYSTPMGAKSSTSHLGKTQYGKTFFHKDMPQIMAAAHLPYVATVAESNPNDFIKKAAKAAAYAREFGTAYVKALSACPLNWNDRPDTERKVIAAAVDCCYFPLYEIERGITSLSYDPKKSHKKIPVTEWFSMMGRTKHLATEEYKSVADQIQAEVDRRYERLAACAEHPLL